MSNIKTNLSKRDKEYFKLFKEQYKDWDIYRLEDGTLVFVPPVRN